MRGGLLPSEPLRTVLRAARTGLRAHSRSGQLPDPVPVPLLMHLHLLREDAPVLHQALHLLPGESGLLLQLGLQGLHLDGHGGRGAPVPSCSHGFRTSTGALQKKTKPKPRQTDRQEHSSNTNRREASAVQCHRWGHTRAEWSHHTERTGKSTLSLPTLTAPNSHPSPQPSPSPHDSHLFPPPCLDLRTASTLRPSSCTEIKGLFVSI